VSRARALGGILGPLAFVVAWAVLGRRSPGYSPVHEPISRLAAVGAPTRSAMTAGFLAFTAGVLPAATVLRRSHSGATGAAAAGVAYAALALTPLAGGRAQWRAGARTAAARSFAVAAATGGCLAVSATSPANVGAWQRAGLLAGDVWIATACYRRLRTTARQPSVSGVAATAKSG
jgi:hypothetical protein